MKLSLLYVSCAFACAPSFAQLSKQDIEVIEVYATKRAQPIKQVTVTLSAIDGEKIDKEQLKDVTAIGHLIPNVKISQNAAEGTTPAINIRGVGLIDYNTSNTSPIAIYQDDVTVGAANNQLVNLFDLESIEVLRGPQGTLFGRNSTGGAILIRNKLPELNTLDGYIKVGRGNLNFGLLEGVANLPINSTMATRISVSSKEYDYSTNNLFPGAKQAGMVQTDYRVSLLGQWDKLDMLFKLKGNDWNGTVNPVGSIGIFKDPINGVLCNSAELGSNNCFDAFGFNDGSEQFFDVMVNNEQAHDTETIGASLNLNYQFNDTIEVTSITAYNSLNRDHGFNCDGSPAQLCEGHLGTKDDAFSQEFRLSSLFDIGHLMAGFYYLHEDIKQDNFNDILRDFRGIISPSLTTTFYYDNTINIESTALFAQFDWQVSNQFTVVLGARYTDETTRYESQSDLNIVLDLTDLSGQMIDYYSVSGSESDDQVSGKLALNYQTLNGMQVYYSLSNGYKSGGYYGGFIATEEQAELAAYGPEYLIANELGLRTEVFDNTWKISAAAFHYDYQDQQVFMNQASAIPSAPPLQLLENVASSTIYGAEIENTWYLGSNLDVSFNIGYLPHAEFDEYTDPLGNKLTDHRLPFTSEWNIATNVNYSMNISNGELAFSIGNDYQSEYYFDQNMNESAMQDDVLLWHANISYSIASWHVNLWGKNLTDEHYSHLKFDLSSFLGMLEDFKAQGRQYGLNLRYQF
ncbi:TonB-dependent receptor [Pseudoalteromonas sp.]|uniref:TonB-dependent receptor n=1 Tax=Pseudoalteromonas sp. TaxID=53249 RepID=UPI00356368B8